MPKVKKTGFFSKKSAVLLLVSAIFAISALVVSKYNHQKNSPKPTSPETAVNNTSSTPSPQSEKEEAEQNKLNKIAASPSQSQGSERVVISSAAQDPKTNQVVVKTELYGSQWQKCTLTLSQGGSTLTREADALYQPTFSSCLGFAINVNDFPSGGAWSAILTAKKTDGSNVVSSAVEVTVTK